MAELILVFKGLSFATLFILSHFVNLIWLWTHGEIVDPAAVPNIPSNNIPRPCKKIDWLGW
jgi:hypothetical protein